MAFFEDSMLSPKLRKEVLSLSEIAAMSDNLMVNIQYPLAWLSKSCKPGKNKNYEYSDVNYSDSNEMCKLAIEYNAFSSAFTYASHGIIALDLHNTDIVIEDKLFFDSRYEAYDRLVLLQEKKPNYTYGDFLPLLEKNLNVSGDRFHYQIGEKIIHAVSSHTKPLIEECFELPDKWEFPDFSLQEFRQMITAIFSISYLHIIARTIAINRGCIGLGINDSILIYKIKKLNSIISRYSQVDYRKVDILLMYLTYGSSGINYPDPALQPLIKLSEDSIGIMPSLIINNSLERNWISLINRIPKLKSHYSYLVETKEEYMRKGIIEGIRYPKIQCYLSNVNIDSQLPDIDLAIISHSEKTVYLIELKWFISPAEVREVLEKSEEIKKGIFQSLQLKQAFCSSPIRFYDRLNVDNSYTLVFLVLSKNMIGIDRVQDPEIPVIQENHFIRYLNNAKDLTSFTDWIISRKYLPVEGVHYEIVTQKFQIKEWKLNWYGIKTLFPGTYD